VTPQWLIDLGRKVRASFGVLSPGFPDEWQLLPALHVNEDGWLEGEGVVTMPSDPSWYYPRLSTPDGSPRAIVAHCSATNVGTGRTMARNRMRPREKTDRAASWHISVEPHEIVQQAPLDVGCWHALGTIKGIGPANRTAVGIEMVGWEKGPWPESQIQHACRVWRAVVQSYGIKRQHALIPHAVLDPERRSDPGKLFMREHAHRVLDFAFA